LAVDAVIALIEDGRCVGDELGGVFRKFFISDAAGWPGLERSETPVFYNVAHQTLRGFLRCASSSPGHPPLTT